MYKYETLGKEIIKFLNEQKKNGNKTYILRATEVNKLFEVSQICGGQREGKNPSSSFTVEYKLTCF